MGDLVFLGVTLQRFSIALDGARSVVNGLSKLTDDHILRLDLISHRDRLILFYHTRNRDHHLQIRESLTHGVKHLVDLFRILFVQLQRRLLMLCQLHFGFMDRFLHTRLVYPLFHASCSLPFV